MHHLVPVSLLSFGVSDKDHVDFGFADILVHQLLSQPAPVPIYYYNFYPLNVFPLLILSFAAGHASDPVICLRLALLSAAQIACLGILPQPFIM